MQTIVFSNNDKREVYNVESYEIIKKDNIDFIKFFDNKYNKYILKPFTQLHRVEELDEIKNER